MKSFNFLFCILVAQSSVAMNSFENNGSLKSAETSIVITRSPARTTQQQKFLNLINQFKADDCEFQQQLNNVVVSDNENDLSERIKIIQTRIDLVNQYQQHFRQLCSNSPLNSDLKEATSTIEVTKKYWNGELTYYQDRLRMNRILSEKTRLTKELAQVHQNAVDREPTIQEQEREINLRIFIKVTNRRFFQIMSKIHPDLDFTSEIRKIDEEERKLRRDLRGVHHGLLKAVRK